MIVVHRKTGIEYPMTIEQWNKLKELDMHRNYNVINNDELVIKEIKLEEKPKRKYTKKAKDE